MANDQEPSGGQPIPPSGPPSTWSYFEGLTKAEVDRELDRMSANIRWLKAWGRPAPRGAGGGPRGPAAGAPPRPSRPPPAALRIYGPRREMPCWVIPVVPDHPRVGGGQAVVVWDDTGTVEVVTFGE